MDPNTILFVPALAFSWLWGFVVALFLAQVFLTVFEDAAAGNPRVVWLHDPIPDYFWKVFWLAFMVLTWGLPAVLTLTYAVRHRSSSEVIWAVVWFGLLFPIGVLCSRANNSPWLPVSAQLLYRLLQKIPTWIGFYLLSFPALAAILVWGFSLFRPLSFERMLAFPLLGAVGWLCYARLLGRFGFLLMFAEGFVLFERREAPEKEVKPTRGRKKRSEPVIEVEPHSPQPAARKVQSIEEGDESVGVYGLEMEKPAAKLVRKKAPKPDPVTEWSDWDGENSPTRDFRPSVEKPATVVREPKPWEGEIPLDLPIRVKGQLSDGEPSQEEFAEENEAIALKPAEGRERTSMEKQHRPAPKELKEEDILMYSPKRGMQEPAVSFDSTMVSFLLQADVLKVLALMYLFMLILSGTTQLMMAYRPGGVGAG